MFKKINTQWIKYSAGRDVEIITEILKYYNKYYKESSGNGIRPVKIDDDLQQKQMETI